MSRVLTIGVLAGCMGLLVVPRVHAAENVFEAHGVQLQWTGLNATLNIDLNTGSVRRNLSLNGQLQFPADRSFAAYIVEPTSVTDAEGHRLMKPKPSRWSGQSSSPSIQRLQMGRGHNGRQGVAMSLDDLDGRPSAIRSIRGVIYLLEVTAQRDIDLPLEPGETWTALTDQVKVRVENVKKQSQNYTVQYEFSGADPQALTKLDAPPFVMGGLPLGDDGKPLALRSPPYHYHSGSNRATVRFYMADANASPSKLRLQLATETAERELKFDLSDLPDWNRNAGDGDDDPPAL